jgi:uncharacterized protein (DUF1810 family)
MNPSEGMARSEFDLDRFIAAQDGGVYERALAEIRAGRKRTHWMWFIFPQLAGLGTSATAQRFGIAGAAEAKSYLAHPVLGRRLEECMAAAAAIEGLAAREAFGTPDDLKLRSSATLFADVSPAGSIFEKVLRRFFGGEPDEKTLGLLAEVSP